MAMLIGLDKSAISQPFKLKNYKITLACKFEVPKEKKKLEEKKKTISVQEL